MTKYKVFTRAPGAESWSLLGEHDAHDSKGAVKAAILAMDAGGQAAASEWTYAATPSGSWQEHAPQVKVETRVSF